MASKSKNPSADAHIDELQAWAARANRASGGAAASAPAPAPTAFSSVPTSGRDVVRPADTGLRGTLLPKVLIALGIGVAAYLVFSFIIGLLMTMLMIVGGVALLYAVFRIGRWYGRRDG